MDKKEFLRNMGVDCDTAIENMMDIETYNELLDDFYSSLDSDIANIEDKKNNMDMENYAILTHALKSNARSFGFVNLGEIAYNHELKGKEKDLNYVNEHFDELKNEVMKVKSIIEKYKNL